MHAVSTRRPEQYADSIRTDVTAESLSHHLILQQKHLLILQQEYSLILNMNTLVIPYYQTAKTKFLESKNQESERKRAGICTYQKKAVSLHAQYIQSGAQPAGQGTNPTKR